MIAAATQTIAAAGLVAVALVTARAASIDIQQRRLPNRLVVAILGVVAVTAAVMVAAGVPLGDAASDVAWGVVFSGAPLLFVIWLVRPNAIGGGDWKMLGVLGAALGLVNPAAAAVAGFVAAFVHLVIAAITRQRTLPYGPALLAGFITGWAVSGLLATAGGTA